MRRAAAVVVCLLAVGGFVVGPGQAAPVSQARVPVEDARAAQGSVTAATVGTRQGAWVRSRIAAGTVDHRFPFTVAAAGRHVITLGGLTGAANLALLDAAGHQLAASSRGKQKFERITRVLTAGSYTVVARRAGRSSSSIRFALRIDRLADDMAVTSLRYRTYNRGTAFELRFLLTNNTAAAVDLGGVYVTFRDAQDEVVRVFPTTCLTRRYAARVLAPGDFCLVEAEGNLSRPASRYRIRPEVGVPATPPVLRQTGLRISSAPSRRCTDRRGPCIVLNRRVTNTSAAAVKDLLLETVRWDAFGRVRDVDWTWTQPRLKPGRSVVMPICSYRCIGPRDLTVTAIPDAYAH